MPCLMYSSCTGRDDIYLRWIFWLLLWCCDWLLLRCWHPGILFSLHV